MPEKSKFQDHEALSVMPAPQHKGMQAACVWSGLLGLWHRKLAASLGVFGLAYKDFHDRINIVFMKVHYIHNELHLLKTVMAKKPKTPV